VQDGVSILLVGATKLTRLIDSLKSSLLYKFDGTRGIFIIEEVKTNFE
jgi:hypothetical protein